MASNRLLVIDFTSYSLEIALKQMRLSIKIRITWLNNNILGYLSKYKSFLPPPIELSSPQPYKQAGKAQEKYYNAKKKFKTYEVGDKVFLITQNLNVLCSRRTQKLDFKKARQFKVTKVINLQAYQLDLEGQLGGIHSVFYVELLKPASTPKGPAIPLKLPQCYGLTSVKLCWIAIGWHRVGCRLWDTGQGPKMDCV